MTSAYVTDFIREGKKAPLDVLKERQIVMRQLICHHKEQRDIALNWGKTAIYNYQANILKYNIEALEEALTKEKAQIDFIQFGLELREKAIVEKKQKKLKKGHIFSEPILQRVDELPEDIVNIIRDFLPIQVWNSLLCFKLLTKLNKISDKDELLRNLYRHVVSSPHSLTLISEAEAISRIRYLNSGHFNPKYCHDFISRSFDYKAGEIKTAISFYVNRAMEINPLFAYKLLKTIAVIAAKKLTSRRYYKCYILTEQDAANANIYISLKPT